MAENETASEELSSADDKCILIVDDDDSVLELLSHVCENDGFRVKTALDGEEALAKMEGRTPDLVLLDMMLPRKGGYEVLRSLQAGENSRVPVLIITAKNFDSSTEQIMLSEPNVAGLVRKPFSPTVLAARFHAILKTRPVTKIHRSFSK